MQRLSNAQSWQPSTGRQIMSEVDRAPEHELGDDVKNGLASLGAGVLRRQQDSTDLHAHGAKSCV